MKYDYDIDYIISQASATMGALKNLWADNTVNKFSKYLIFAQFPAICFYGDMRVGKFEKQL